MVGIIYILYVKKYHLRHVYNVKGGINPIIINTGTASTYPEPANKEEFLRRQLYDYDYPEILPPVYDWPHTRK